MKKFSFIILFIAIIGIASSSGFGTLGHRGPVTGHFDGKRFYNLAPRENRDYKRILSDLVRGDLPRGHWQSLPVEKFPIPPGKVGGDNVKITFVNHATVLIQTQGVNILTDPIWSETCGPLPFVSPRRFRDPGVKFSQLPKIDVVLVSHSHYDHLDLPTLKDLWQRDQPVFIVGIGNQSLLKDVGVKNVQALDWWQNFQLNSDITITGTPAQHWSRRGLRDQNTRLWMSYVIQTPQSNLYFAGDTAMGPHFEQIRQRFGPMRFSALPIGAFEPRWFMRGSHISPEEAVEVHQILQSETSLAIHFGTFRLGTDGQFAATDALKAARELNQVEAEEFMILDFGEGRMLPLPGSRLTAIARQ